MKKNLSFEDVFGIDGTKGTDDWDDMDFNDVVLVIEGELPISENKRFFAHPFSSDKVGDVELIVGSKFEDTLEDALARIAEEEGDKPGSNRWLDSDANDKRPTISRFPANGDIPAMWTGTTNVRWMKELQKITLGYENFYGGGEVVNGVPQWWRSGLHDSFWYQFLGDEPD